MSVSEARQQAHVRVNQGQVGTLSQTLALSYVWWVGMGGGLAGGGEVLQLLL